MRIEAISFQIYREIIENNFPFPPEFGGVPGRLGALLAKSLPVKSSIIGWP
jgi:hypothetical protein